MREGMVEKAERVEGAKGRAQESAWKGERDGEGEQEGGQERVVGTREGAVEKAERAERMGWGGGCKREGAGECEEGGERWQWRVRRGMRGKMRGHRRGRKGVRERCEIGRTSRENMFVIMCK